MFGSVDIDREITGNYGEDGYGEKVCCYCSECADPIYVGDRYYKFGDETICEECIENHERIGELDV